MSLLSLTTSDWHARAAKLRYETRHYIDGKYVDSIGGGRFTVVNPATGAPLCEMSAGGAADVDAAVASAKRSFAARVWSRKAPRERAAVLGNFARLILENTERFALLDTLCMGKPIRDMVTIDVPAAATNFTYFGELIDKIDGAVTATASDAFHYILREPLGVVGCIVPWNYPLLMAAWKVAPALAAGNSVVLKPAEQSPLSGPLMAELFVAAGGPPGVFNVVGGLGEAVGAPLALHKDVAKIAFTGSTEIGKQMLIYAGQSNMKRVSLECGGKTPQIFLADLPDIDTAVTYAINGIYGNMGEVCNAGSRLLIDKPIAEQFLARFIERGKTAYRAGDPLGSGDQSGAARDRVAPCTRHELHRARQVRGGEARIRRQRTRLARLIRESDAVYRRQQPHDDRPGGDFRTGRRGDRDQRGRRGPGDRQRFDLRTCRLGMDARPQRRAQDRARSGSRRDLGQLLRSRRHDAAVRRL